MNKEECKQSFVCTLFFLIKILKEQGLLKTERQTNQTVYLLGETYQSKNGVINKALSIGLQKMKEDGEI